MAPSTRASRDVLLYCASETDADILYPTGFFAPDPFLFVQKGRTRILVMSDLERDRAKKQARVDRVLSWTAVCKRAGGGRAARDRGRRDRARAPGSEAPPRRGAAALPARPGDGARRAGRAAGRWSTTRSGPSARSSAPDEVRAITQALRAAEAGLEAGLAALRSCRIGRDGYLRRDGRRFTAEDLRSGGQHADHGGRAACPRTPSARRATRRSTRTRRATGRSARTRRSSWTSSRARRRPATSATSRARSCAAAPASG